MNLTGDDLRAAYYVASEVIRTRRRTGQPIPDWLRKHYTLLDAAMRVSPTRQPVVENGAPDQHSRDDIIGSREVAAMLNLTERQVQRRAAQLGGTRVCGRLLFLRADIADHAEGRRRDG
jgi:hypothetical protein